MRTKYFILGVITSLAVAACSTIFPLPAFNNRIYHFCSDTEDPNPVGKLCYPRCVNRGLFSDKCKEWEIDKKEITDSSNFYKFRAAGFKCSVGL